MNPRPPRPTPAQSTPAQSTPAQSTPARYRSLPDVSIRQLEYLVAVADAPTWASAAERVGVSASALSQGLAELERRVQVELFESQGRRRVLRSSARPVLDHARRVVALTGDLLDWSERMRGGVTGRVRLGLIDVAAVGYFPDVVRSFRRDRPEVELVVSVAPSAVLLDDLRDGKLDVVVCVEPPTARPGLDSEGLLDEPLHVLAPPGTDIGDPVAWGPWLLFPEGSHTRASIAASLGRSGARMAIAAESHQPDVLLQMANMGLGWTVLPIAGQLGGVTVGPELIRRRLILARRSGSVVDPAVDDLAALIMADSHPV